MKYAGKTIIEIAQERGSSSATQAGAKRFLLAWIKDHRSGLSVFSSRRRSSRYDWATYRTVRRDRTGEGRALILGHALQDAADQWAWYAEAYNLNYRYDRDCEQAITRDGYGCACFTSSAARTVKPRPEVAAWRAAWEIVTGAEKARAIPSSYDTIDFDRKGRADGSALHHEMFDFTDRAALLCLRETEGTRYGVRTARKRYVLITRKGRGYNVAETSEPVAKLAKSGAPYGSIIARVQGKKGAAKLPAPEITWETAYKTLALVDGSLRSIYSGEPYELGKLKREKAQDGHSGGYYCYRTPDEARACVVPDNSKLVNAPRVVVKVEVAGACVPYGNGKMARTYLRPVEIIG